MGSIRAKRHVGAAVGRASAARAVVLAGTVVALILVVAILLVVLGASHGNELVKAVRSAARFLAGPFDGLFSLHHRKASTAVNWGIAAVVWYAVARLIARLMLRR
jgi:uncharacterized membrane protein YfbV (UPF0208 family)